MEVTNTTTEWLTSPLLLNPITTNFSSPEPLDTIILNHCQDFTTKWTETSLTHLPTDTTSAAPALKWAILSTYCDTPTVNLLICPKYDNSNGIWRLIKHTRICILADLSDVDIFIPAYSWRKNPNIIHAQRQPILLLAAANPAGIATHIKQQKLNDFFQALPCSAPTIATLSNTAHHRLTAWSTHISLPQESPLMTPKKFTKAYEWQPSPVVPRPLEAAYNFLWQLNTQPNLDHL